MIFAIALLHTIIAGFSSSAAVLDGRTKESSECSSQDCGSLYLLKSTGEEIPLVSSITRMKEKDVVGARVVGAGCFTIFKGKDFSGSSIIAASSTRLMFVEQGHHWSTVKSVKYSPVCRRQAGVHLGHLGLAGLLALVLFVGLVSARLHQRRRRQKDSDFSKVEEMSNLKPDGYEYTEEQQSPICKTEIPRAILAI